MKAQMVDGVPFRSREISWLAFNSRVLQEAGCPDVPLGDRLRFLSIYSSNLDEFFRVRVATLRRLVLLGKDYRKLRIPDPKQTLLEARAIIRKEAALYDRTGKSIFAGLAGVGIRCVLPPQVPESLRPWLRDYFYRTIRPRIMPIMVRSWSELKTLRDHPMYLAIEMARRGKKTRASHALIEIPSTELPRFVRLPDFRGQTLVMYLDDIIRFGLPELFTGLPYDTYHAYAIKFTRDAEMELDEDITESYYDKIAEGVRSRNEGQAVRMNYDSRIPVPFLRLLVQKLNFGDEDTLLPGSRYHNRRDLAQFPVPDHLLRAPVRSWPHGRLCRPAKSGIFRILQQRDLLLHFPWHTFNHFLDLLREASLDPMVESIRITQYRVARNSCVARALTTAARNGKEVIVMVEPQARFDEKNNIAWANDYQENGVRVIFGVSGIKVHAKMCVVVRRERGRTRTYSVISTGNFNEDTARTYTDHMLLTSHAGIGGDILEAFRFFETNWQPPRLNHLIAAPFHLRAGVRFWIQNEIRNYRQGKEASIFLKLNNLADPEIAGLLYEASQAGVPVRLLVRSMFALVTGDPKFSATIRAAGIVDRFLEHSRILIFSNGGDPRYFLSSADFLPRNFDSRFEIVAPVYDESLQTELHAAMEMQWADNTKSRELDRKLTNRIAKRGKKKVRYQEDFGAWLEENGLLAVQDASGEVRTRPL